MPSLIDKATFAERISGRAIARADGKYFAIDRVGEDETIMCIDRKTAARLRDALSAWLEQTKD